MAGLPLNNFKTITAVVPLSPEVVYTTPLGFKSVFLLAQVTNIGTTNQNVSFLYQRPGLDPTEIVSNFTIPPDDTLNLLTGKLVLETNDSIKIVGSSDTDLKFIASILETSA